MISDSDINDIGKVFPIKFEGRSRIDNYPFFTFKNNDLEITDIKPEFYKYLRKEKLIKLNISF